VVTQTFGASHLLRNNIADNDKAEVFISANIGYPLSLAKAGKTGPIVMFARKKICALVKPSLVATATNLVERMLNPGIELEK
jgi:molybdate transport system substrate-binding protein